MWGSPIFAMAEARNFKFYHGVGFANPIIKSHAEEKVGVDLV